MAKDVSAPLRETDLYDSIHDYLVAQGYTVRAEVKHCDITACKGDELIIIELKRQFSIDLLVQAIDRQRITDSVYVALPGPIDKRRRSRWRGIKCLLRRLELGLIVVTFSQKGPRVEVVFHPLPSQRQKLKRRRRAVLQEMADRTGNYNQGGSTRRKLVTAYRENAIYIACCLEKLGPLAPRQLRALGTGPKTLSILSKNFYEWFERVDRAMYAITSHGRSELDAYPDVVAQYRKRLDKQENA